MKALAKTRPQPGVELIELPIPHPKEGEMLVRVGACGICGSDLHIYDWELGAERFASRLPMVIGHEPAGEVVELGPGVKRFKAGDRVALDPFGPCGRCGPCLAGRFHLCASPTSLSGALAEFTIAPLANAWRVPESMSYDEAALLEPFGTGLHAVEQSSLKAGDSTVIEGPGPIGLSIAIAARAFGVCSIVVTGLRVDSERLKLAREMGFKTACADDADWIDQVRALVPDGGADAVFDANGSMDSIQKLIRRGGELIQVGWPARDIPSTELRGLFFHGVNLINSRVRTPETWRRAIAMVANKSVELMPMVTHRYPLAKGLEAFELLRARKGVKALVLPSESH